MALPGDGVDQHGAPDVGAAEQADGLDDPGGNPPGIAAVVHLKDRGGEHIGGILEPEVPYDIAVERLGGRVLDSLPVGQADHGGLLADHVDDDVGGQAVGAVGKPLDEVGVLQGGHPHRLSLIVDLGVGVGHLKLADHVGEGAHLAVAQNLDRILVQPGDLVKGDLGDVHGEVAVGDGQQVPVGAGAEDGHGDHLAQNRHNHQGGQQNADGQALGFDKAQVFLHSGGALQIKAGGHQGGENVHQAQEQDKSVEIPGVQVEGGNRDIEIDRAHRQHDQQVGENFARLVFRAAACFGCFLTQMNRSFRFSKKIIIL